ncbi:MAG: HEPN domain-containing protein [Candidatus Methanoperedens sp.]|nr:HEPN domain-containing protein [Candidatus Methanoperedens sp.]
MTTNKEQGEKLLKEAQWIFERDLKIEKDSLKEIERISRWLSEARAPSFYGERDFTPEDAKKAFEDAAFVLRQLPSIS